MHPAGSEAIAETKSMTSFVGANEMLKASRCCMIMVTFARMMMMMMMMPCLAEDKSPGAASVEKVTFFKRLDGADLVLSRPSLPIQPEVPKKPWEREHKLCRPQRASCLLILRTDTFPSACRAGRRSSVVCDLGVAADDHLDQCGVQPADAR